MTPARAVVVVLAFAYAAVVVFWRVTSQPWRILDPPWMDGVLKLALWAVPALLIAAWVATRPIRDGGKVLGFRGHSWVGYTFGLVATLPMAVALLFGGWPYFSAASVTGTVLLGPIGEEALFRGLLLLVLISVGRWPAWTAILMSSAAFAIAHLYSFPVPVGQLVISSTPFGATFVGPLAPDSFYWVEYFGLRTMGFFLGGLLFGWVAYRWRSLWPAIGLHAFINLWWDASAGPFGIASVRRVSFDALPVAHALSVILAVALTLRYTRRPV